MSDVSFTRDFECGPDPIRQLLLDDEFLTQFVKLQHPVEYDIDVNIGESTSTMHWLLSTERIPGVVRRFVGQTIPIRMVVTSPEATSDQDGSINLDLESKIKGQLQASLSLQPIDQHGAQTALVIRGAFDMSAGLLSGKASEKARDHLIVPLLGQLADLLQEWCGAPS